MHRLTINYFSRSVGFWLLIPVLGFAAPAPSPTPVPPHSDQRARLEAIRKGTFGRTTAVILDASKAKDDPSPQAGDAALVKQLERDAALGRWQAMSERLASAFPDNALREEAFQAILNALIQPKTDPQVQQNESQVPQSFRPTPQLKLSDVADLMKFCPAKKPSDALLGTYVSLVKTASQPAPELDEFLKTLEKGAGPFGGQDEASRLLAAKVLLNSGKGKEAGPFLPPASETQDNVAILNLQARNLEAVYNEKKRTGDLEMAWKTAVAAFKSAKTPGPDRDEALAKLVSLADRVREPLGNVWLQEALAEQADVSMEILSNAGLQTVKNRLGVPQGVRLQNLKLQQRVVEAVLKAAPARATDWRSALELLAQNWRTEAEWSLQQDRTSTRGPQMEFDPFGNVFFGQPEQQFMQNPESAMVPPLSTADILKYSPSEEWIKALDPSLQPGFQRLLAQLHLKVKEDKEAFPYIEKVASVRPDLATALAEQFLDVWAEKNDPNNEQRRTNRYMFIYGYNPTSQGIPLTRSRQMRNLEDLAEWTRKIRALPLENFREQKILDAFVKCHSMAEVYRLEDAWKVLGAVDDLSPETVAAFARAMRINLAGQWKDEKIQLKASTGRKEKDIREEVLKGYAAAQEIVSAQLQKNPGHWQLLMERGALLCDENAFRSEEKKDSDFARRRQESFADFQAAAAAYAKALPGLEDKDQSADVFTTWFYVSMGASDLAKVRAEQVPGPQQIPLIREAITSLGGEAAEKHETLFANALATRISAVQPAVKQRYVEMGLPIAGENDRAKSVRDVADFYKDIVKEIALDVKVDGVQPVGTDPFGAWVNIRHTTEVEKAGGGFQKYLVNQNNQPMFWNFGRPPENYRDKFSEGVKEALSETFDVQSITFHNEKVQSQADPQPGWRVTPYAYIHLKSKGPQVDVIPPLKLNLDFTETGGYVILPVSSGRVPIDSSKPPAATELYKIDITQTLDERKLAEGKLDLEIQASAEGLLPPLDKLLKMDFGDFAVISLDDQGVQINELQAVPDDSSKVLTSRTWTAKLQRKPGAGTLFRFPRQLNSNHHVTSYRYEGNDLIEVKGDVTLGTGHRLQLAGIVLPLVLLVFLGAAIGAFFWRQRRKQQPQETAAPLRIPEPLNPLNLLGFLQQIRKLPSLNAATQSELDQDIVQIENSCYAPQPADSAAPDLHEIAQTWLQRVQAMPG